jgi:hypothetical protein
MYFWFGTGITTLKRYSDFSSSAGHQATHGGCSSRIISGYKAKCKKTLQLVIPLLFLT